MDEIIQIQDHYYILAASSRVNEHSRVLKHGDTFAVFDHFGNIQHIGLGEQGLYHDGTRFLSRWEFRIRGRRPLLLSSSVTEQGALTVDLTNPDIVSESGMALARDQIHVFRRGFLWNAVYYERLRLRNFSLAPAEFRFELCFDADFADIFEVRGVKRARRGRLLEPKLTPSSLQLAYVGMDSVERRTCIEFAEPPAELTASRCEYRMTLSGHDEKSFFVAVSCEAPQRPAVVVSFEEAARAIEAHIGEMKKREAGVRTSNEQFNAWLDRSAADLRLMTTRTPHGAYPYAGIPWFSTPFGRDGILTALECLWLNPELARGVLAYLAATQACEYDSRRDAEPGKILHETRGGEMARLGEIPFGRYYGSVDATPLFVVLAGAYYDRTGDLDFVRSIWPNVEHALRWIDADGDKDGDGFVEFAPASRDGLCVQGWKDSFDAIFHDNGSLAAGPIALCEVQGYVYAARLAAARLATALEYPEKAKQLTWQADRLQQQFEDAFWCESLSTYALALDGQKRPCRVRTSNAGQCLFSGIARADRAARVAETLFDEASYSGWGIRTIASGESRYNPMSYHNGSIWPHDNAMIAVGLARYRLSNHVARVFEGLYDASRFFELHRMPELFCGFVRRAGEGPTLYPVACAPQSWAAAAVFCLIQSLLGMTIDAPARQILFARAVLPEAIQKVWIQDLRVGTATVDLAIERFPLNVGIEVIRREGDVELVVLK